MILKILELTGLITWLIAKIVFIMLVVMIVYDLYYWDIYVFYLWK